MNIRKRHAFRSAFLATALSAVAVSGLSAQQPGDGMPPPGRHGGPHGGRGEEGPQHHVHGQVTAVYANYFSVRDERGQAYNVGYSASTTFFRGGDEPGTPQASSASSVKVGEWIGVRGRIDENTHVVVAESIRVSGHALERKPFQHPQR